MNSPSCLASCIPCAATVPSPGILFNGGRIPSTSTLNFTASDSYKSIGKKFKPLSYISRTISKTPYVSWSFFVAAFPASSISFILFFTRSTPWHIISLSNASALIEKYAA